jgi:hypothetical protein
MVVITPDGRSGEESVKAPAWCCHCLADDNKKCDKNAEPH